MTAAPFACCADKLVQIRMKRVLVRSCQRAKAGRQPLDFFPNAEDGNIPSSNGAAVGSSACAAARGTPERRGAP